MVEEAATGENVTTNVGPALQHVRLGLKKSPANTAGMEDEKKANGLRPSEKPANLCKLFFFFFLFSTASSESPHMCATTAVHMYDHTRLSWYRRSRRLSLSSSQLVYS